MMLGTFYLASIAAWLIAPVETSAMTWAAGIAVCILIGGYVGRVARAN